MKIVIEGFLYKQGRLVKNWKKRWCCLYPNRLLYYDSKESADKLKKPLGEVLIGVDSAITPDILPTNGINGCPQENANDCCFAILPKAGGREYYFICETRDEMLNHWLAKLKQVQQLLIAEPKKAHASIRGLSPQAPTEQLLEKSVYSSLQEAIHFASELRDALARSGEEGGKEARADDRLAMCFQLSERLQDAMEIFENVCEHPDFVFGSGGGGGKGSFVTHRPSGMSSSSEGNSARSPSPPSRSSSSNLGSSRENPPPSPKTRMNSPRKQKAPLPPSSSSSSSLTSSSSPSPSSPSSPPPSPKRDVDEDDEEFNALMQQQLKGSKIRKKKKDTLPTFQQGLFDGPEEKVADDKETADLNFKKKVESEIVASEKVYNEQIKVLLDQYVEPLSICMKQAEMAKEYKDTLFGNIDAVYSVSCELLKAMEAAVEEQKSLADVLIEMEEPILRTYAQYVSNYHTAVSLLARITETEETSLCNTLKEIEKDLLDRGIHPLKALIIQPVQRCPRYVLLLKNALNYTPVVHPDWNGYRIVVNKYERLAATVNSAKTTNEHLEAIINIQKQISGNPLNLAEPGRKFIHSGRVTVKSKDIRPGLPKEAVEKVSHKEKEDEDNTGTVFLFSDTLLFTKETKSLLSDKSNARGGVIGEFVNDKLASSANQFVGFLLLECLEVVDVEDDDFTLGFRYKGQREEDTYYIETNKGGEKQKWIDVIAEQQEMLGLMDPSRRGMKSYSSAAIVKSGWIHKRGHLIKSVNRRWFTLQGHTLFYFQDEHETNPKGSINLLEYTLERDPAEDTKKLLCVRICHTEKRNFWIWFESYQDLNDWTKVLTPNVLFVKMGAENFF